jgi:hypothetical protein
VNSDDACALIIDYQKIKPSRLILTPSIMDYSTKNPCITPSGLSMGKKLVKKTN